MIMLSSRFFHGQSRNGGAIVILIGIGCVTCHSHCQAEIIRFSSWDEWRKVHSNFIIEDFANETEIKQASRSGDILLLEWFNIVIPPHGLEGSVAVGPHRFYGDVHGPDWPPEYGPLVFNRFVFHHPIVAVAFDVLGAFNEPLIVVTGDTQFEVAGGGSSTFFGVATDEPLSDFEIRNTERNLEFYEITKIEFVIAVPEPRTLAFCVAALVILANIRRRKSG
jgi:hypothetical protein